MVLKCLAAIATCLTIIGGFGCGGAAPNTPRAQSAKAQQARRSGRTTEKVRGIYEDENSRRMSYDRVTKWRWQGDRRDCRYVVNNECFTTARQACRQANCGDRQCEIAEGGAPVLVMCEGDNAAEWAEQERQRAKQKSEKAKGQFDDSEYRDRPRREFKGSNDDDDWSNDDDQADDDDRADKERAKKRRRRRRRRRRRNRD